MEHIKRFESLNFSTGQKTDTEAKKKDYLLEFVFQLQLNMKDWASSSIKKILLRQQNLRFFATDVVGKNLAVLVKIF